ncbi:protealysin inhibitor emfourin [Agromyces marinus]|uniref:Activator of Hsp90 ATPase homolog 1-like protein n=1 Tax=Agromyces marinus TaxID=1389020 RepID=A0ABN6Y837_9MICO|nr:protealysin inhibitor emfourin [Agromyces marinus]UIP58250.1 hypothetical protein DSM26151_11210 [Agromyces marinus]BDZ53504.1 hypothetical protein GCM10025870_05770 [Agromyces marinus]
MEVEVTRSGGFAGLRLTWTVQVEDQPDPEEWVLLVERLPWGRTPPVPAEPDRFEYRIRCTGETASAAAPPERAATQPEREATLAERQVTGPWRELVDRVTETAEPERRRTPTEA